MKKQTLSMLLALFVCISLTLSQQFTGFIKTTLICIGFTCFLSQLVWIFYYIIQERRRGGWC